MSDKASPKQRAAIKKAAGASDDYVLVQRQSWDDVLPDKSGKIGQLVLYRWDTICDTYVVVTKVLGD